MSNDPLVPTAGGGPLDGLFNLNAVLLIILSFCCQPIPLILGIVGLLTAGNAKAKSNATIVVIVSVLVIMLGGGLYFFVPGLIGGLIGGGAAAN